MAKQVRHDYVPEYAKRAEIDAKALRQSKDQQWKDLHRKVGKAASEGGGFFAAIGRLIMGG